MGGGRSAACLSFMVERLNRSSRWVRMRRPRMVKWFAIYSQPKNSREGLGFRLRLKKIDFTE